MIFGALGEYALGQEADDAIASGATLDITLSLAVVGSAAGDATAAGDTVDAAVVLIAGAATATTSSDGFAPGDVVEVGVTLIPGAATTGNGSNEIGWWGPPARPNYQVPVRRVNVVAPGADIDIGVALFAGTAFGIDSELVMLGEILELDLAA